MTRVLYMNAIFYRQVNEIVRNVSLSSRKVHQIWFATQMLNGQLNYVILFSVSLVVLNLFFLFLILYFFLRVANAERD